MILKLLALLMPVAVAAGLIVAFRRAVPALFLTCCLLAVAAGRLHRIPPAVYTHPVPQGVLKEYGNQVGAGVFTVLVLTAGIGVVNGGPAAGFARRLVVRIAHPEARLAAGLGMATVCGFGSSVLATQFLADLFDDPSRKPGEIDADTAAIVLGGCTFGSLLVPMSVWWLFFKGALDGVTSPLLRVLPIIYCASLAWLLIWRKHSARRGAVAPRASLRVVPEPLALRQALPWLAFFGTLVLYPMLWGVLHSGATREEMGWTSLTAAVIANVLAMAYTLCLDMHGPLQALWPLPARRQAGAAGAAVALAAARKTTPAVAMARSRGGDRFVPLADGAAAEATHLLFAAPGRAAGLGLSRFRISLGRQWEMWEEGIAKGLGATLVFVTALVFRSYFQYYAWLVDFRLEASGVAAVLFGFALVLGLGLLAGTMMGSAFGTFALILAVAGRVCSTSTGHFWPALIGLLIAVAAAVNSSSPQADNVCVIAQRFQVPPSVVGGLARGTVLRALAITACAAAVLPLFVH